MTLDEAIKHCEEKAKSNRNEVKRGAWEKDSLTEQRCIRCAEEHEQLAEWLKELKAYKDSEPPVIKINPDLTNEEVERLMREFQERKQGVLLEFDTFAGVDNGYSQGFVDGYLQGIKALRRGDTE